MFWGLMKFHTKLWYVTRSTYLTPWFMLRIIYLCRGARMHAVWCNTILRPGSTSVSQTFIVFAYIFNWRSLDIRNLAFTLSARAVGQRGLSPDAQTRRICLRSCRGDSGQNWGWIRQYLSLLYDWRESCLLIGPICLHKSLCLPGNWSELAQKVI